MSFAAIAMPDGNSLADITQSPIAGSFRVILTVRPYGEPPRSSEIHVSLSPDSGIIREVIDDAVVGERRADEGRTASLDLLDRSCLLRTGPSLDGISRLFQHLAGPAAFAYSTSVDPAWRRLTVGREIVLYRRGPYRVGATFDSATRLPLSAATESARITWTYAPSRIETLHAPDVFNWRLEETTANPVPPGPPRRRSFLMNSLLPQWNEIVDADAVSEHEIEVTSFRSTSMPGRFHHVVAQPPGDAPHLRISLGDVAIPDDPSARPGFEISRALRSDSHRGRIWAASPAYLLVTGPTDQPIDITSLLDEPLMAWRSRVAATVASIASEPPTGEPDSTRTPTPA